MIVFCGAPVTSAQYGSRATRQLNLAFALMFAYEPLEVVIIAQSPLVNLASGSSLRPA